MASESDPKQKRYWHFNEKKSIMSHKGSVPRMMNSVFTKIKNKKYSVIKSCKTLFRPIN